MAYNSAYTGSQVDAAVGAVRQKETKWDNKQDELTGTEDQLVGFNSAGEATAVPKPTAADVGAMPAVSGGTTGQVLTKGLGMAVEWKDPPQTGMTQDQADQRYLKLSGGTMQGDVNFSAGEDPSMPRGVKFTVNMESAYLHGLNEGSGTMLEASDQMGELVRLRFADPVASTDGATKGYVDGKAPKSIAITLAASAWSNGSQTVTVAGVKSSGQSVRISPATKADADNWVSAGVWCNEPATANQLTFTCDTAPEADIGINVEIQEVQD